MSIDLFYIHYKQFSTRKIYQNNNRIQIYIYIYIYKLLKEIPFNNIKKEFVKINNKFFLSQFKFFLEK